MIKRFLLPLVAALAAAALAAGCGDDEASGGDGEETAITTSSLTKAQYVKQASKVCDDAEARIFKEFKTFQPDEKLKKRLVAAVPVIVAPATEDQIEELRELGAPKGSEKEIEAMLATMQKEFDAAVQEQEQNDSQTAVEFFDGFNRFDVQAERYGIEDCAFNF